MSAKEKPEVLFRVGFPLYTLRMITDRHLLVAGGGGISKTGVINSFVILEISHNGKSCVAEELSRYVTEKCAVMNCTSYNNGKYILLATGLDNECQLYQLKLKLQGLTSEDDVVIERKKEVTPKSLRRRKISESPPSEQTEREAEDRDNRPKEKTRADLNSNSVLKQHVFTVLPLDKVQTDKSTKEEGFQKVVCMTPDGKLMLTAGVDGHIRVWELPALNLVKDIEAHEKEIDDLDVSQDGVKVVSVSKDNSCFIWNIKDGSKHGLLDWKPPDGVKYNFKRCRFGTVEGNIKKTKLFVIANPVGWPRHPSFIQKWNAKLNMEKSVTTDGSLSALAVSSDGTFLATGSMFTGSVDIYISFSLQKVKHVEAAHSTFITGLDFIPSTEHSRAITGNNDASVISISVDNRICIHHVGSRMMVNIWVAYLLVAVVLVFTFIFCSYLGL